MTPVRIDQLKQILEETEYPAEKTQYLIQSFSKGFDLGYHGPEDVQKYSPNLMLRVGSPTVLWNKVMKEVKNL